jgi:hypothetical protein
LFVFCSISSGGAVFFDSDTSFVIYHCKFENCECSGGCGGAVAINTILNKDRYFQIVSFINNKAKNNNVFFFFFDFIFHFCFFMF